MGDAPVVRHAMAHNRRMKMKKGEGRVALPLFLLGTLGRYLAAQ